MELSTATSPDICNDYSAYSFCTIREKVQEALEKFEERLIEYEKKLQDEIDRDLKEVNIRTSRLAPVLNRRRSDLTQATRMALNRIERDLKEIEKKAQGMDKEIKKFRKKLAEDTISEVLLPQLESVRDRVTNYLEVACLESCTVTGLIEALIEKISDIEAIPFPEKPIREAPKNKIGCGYIFVFAAMGGGFFCPYLCYCINRLDSWGYLYSCCKHSNCFIPLVEIYQKTIPLQVI